MTSIDVTEPGRAHAPSRTGTTASFGRHRMGDIPQSAMRAGASTQPKVFRSAANAQPAQRSNFDEPPTLIELALAPYFRLFGRGPRGAVIAASLGLAALIAIRLF